jgi:hypothetical protein
MYYCKILSLLPAYNARNSRWILIKFSRSYSACLTFRWRSNRTFPPLQLKINHRTRTLGMAEAYSYYLYHFSDSFTSDGIKSAPILLTWNTIWMECKYLAPALNQHGQWWCDHKQDNLNIRALCMGASLHPSSVLIMGSLTFIRHCK